MLLFLNQHQHPAQTPVNITERPYWTIIWNKSCLNAAGNVSDVSLKLNMPQAKKSNRVQSM